MKLNYKHTVRACYLGYITQAIVNNLAPMLFLIFRDEFGLSLGKITLITTVNFCVQLTVDLLSAGVVDKVGYRISITAAHAFAAAGLIGMAILPSVLPDAYWGLLIAVVLYAIGGGITEVLISPIVEACPGDDKAGAMSLLHSFYCWGTVSVVLLSTLFLLVFGKRSWRILSCLWAVVPLFNLWLFTKVPINTLPGSEDGRPVRSLVKSGIFWLLFVLMIASGASEQGMSQWASAFAESGLGLSKALGDVAGPCLFSVMMGLSRALYGKYGGKKDLLGFVTGSAALCAAAYLLTVFAPAPALSLLGCALCGFSVGILWPGMFSIAAVQIPAGGTAMFALLALAGDLGCASGPTLVGFVSGRFSDRLQSGLLAAVGFPAVLICCALILKKYRRSKMTSLE